ncbi:MAG: dUTP diphosphatase [Methyloligellaceae bacterium]
MRPAEQISDVVAIGVKRLTHGAGLPLPAYQTAQAAGFDIAAALPADQPIELKPGERVLVPTGFSFELPAGYECQVRPRSGLAFKHGITVLNAPGTIDSDYRGEIQVLLINHGASVFEIARGDRIAQIVVQPVVQAHLEEREVLGETDRGAGGFGSTGQKTTSQ